MRLSRLSTKARIFHSILLTSVFSFLFAPKHLSAATGAEIDRMAKEMLSTLPGGKLSLEVVLSQAKQRSESYAAIRSLESTAEAALLRSEAPYDFVLTSQLARTLNELEKGNPFEPTRLEVTNFRVGVRKYLSTGTLFDFGASTGPTSLGFPPGAPGSESSIDYNETRFDFGLRQSLWRDAFGVGSRLGRKSGELSAESQKQQRLAETEDWALAITEQFYQAWLAQNQVRDALENVEKRKRLRNVTRLRVSRGTAEKPDTLAAESAVVTAEIDLRQALERLQQSWLLLATVLKLPNEIASRVDPMKIPLDLDRKDPSVEKLCASAVSPAGSAKSLRAKTDVQRSAVEVERAKVDGRPDLSLSARYFTNGIDSSLPNSTSEAARLSHPGWELGLSLEWPLEMSDSEARNLEAKSFFARANAQAQSISDREAINWSIRCQELKRREADLDALRENAKRQNERANLEQYRFSIGRIRMDEVTRAEDEALFANARARQEEIELRRTIWAIRELNGEIAKFVEALP